MNRIPISVMLSAALLFGYGCRERVSSDGVPIFMAADSGNDADITHVANNASVEAIVLARDSGGRPGAIVSAFHPRDNPLHAMIRLSGVERGTRVRAVWSAVEAGGETDYIIATQDLTAEIRGNVGDFMVSLPRSWPVGRYRVDVYLGDRLARSQEFAVQE